MGAAGSKVSPMFKGVDNREVERLLRSACTNAVTGQDEVFLRDFLEQSDKLNPPSVGAVFGWEHARMINVSSYSSRRTLLQSAVRGGNRHIIELIMSYNPDVKAYSVDGETLVHVATNLRRGTASEIKKAAETLEYVLSLPGVEVDQPSKESPVRESHTALFSLFLDRTIPPEILLEFSKILLAHGANPNSPNEESPLLLLALRLVNGDETFSKAQEKVLIEIVKNLIDAGCNIEARRFYDKANAIEYCEENLPGLAILIKDYQREVEARKKAQNDAVIAKISEVREEEDATVHDALRGIQYAVDRSWQRKQVLRLLTTPPCFVCPLTKKIMRNPAVTSAGVSYEEDAIKAKLQETPQIDPLSGKTITADLVTNFGLKSLIGNYCKRTIVECLEFSQEMMAQGADEVKALLIERARNLNAILKDSKLAADIEKCAAAKSSTSRINKAQWLKGKMDVVLEEVSGETYRDAVTLEFIHQPVITSAGHTYENTSAANLSSDPQTRAPITSRTPNFNFIVATNILKDEFEELTRDSIDSIETAGEAAPELKRNLQKILKDKRSVALLTDETVQSEMRHLEAKEAASQPASAAAVGDVASVQPLSPVTKSTQQQ